MQVTVKLKKPMNIEGVFHAAGEVVTSEAHAECLLEYCAAGEHCELVDTDAAPAAEVKPAEPKRRGRAPKASEPPAAAPEVTEPETAAKNPAQE